jgi:hypothetical protein
LTNTSRESVLGYNLPTRWASVSHFCRGQAAGRKWPAHRVVYALSTTARLTYKHFKKYKQSGRKTLSHICGQHMCVCVNPEHLFWELHSTNMETASSRATTEVVRIVYTIPSASSTSLCLFGGRSKHY